MATVSRSAPKSQIGFIAAEERCLLSGSGGTDGGGASESPEALRRRIRGLEDEVAALQRMALLGTMSAMVAHEFNNLMTPILARAQIALDGGDAAAVDRALNSAVVNSQRAIGITAHLLGLTRNDSEDVAACGAAEIVREALEIAIRPRDRSPIAVAVDVADGLSVAAPPLIFRQVLLNLILNARTAMRERGGTLTISARPDGGSVHIEVSDTGVGMPVEHLEGVLNPFLAADPLVDPRDWRSVGLGLNVCRTLVRQFGASLRARLNDGPGCTFELRWPIG